MTEADLLDAWPTGAGPPLQRFTQLFGSQAVQGGEETRSWAEQSLGACNRQLVQLHRQVVGRPVEAVVTCTCGVDMEVMLPLDAIAETPEPAPQIEIAAPGPRRFRLPYVSELAFAEQPLELARRCALDAGGPVPDAYLGVLDAAWAKADPAADLGLDLSCPACGSSVVAHVDLALFVARDLDLKVQGLVAEIHGLAQAYGWTETEILAVPPSRRRSYAALITGAPA